jgi:hypothetical protein
MNFFFLYFSTSLICYAVADTHTHIHIHGSASSYVCVCTVRRCYIPAYTEGKEKGGRHLKGAALTIEWVCDRDLWRHHHRKERKKKDIPDNNNTILFLSLKTGNYITSRLEPTSRKILSLRWWWIPDGGDHRHRKNLGSTTGSVYCFLVKMVVVSYSKWRCCLSSFFRPGAWFRHIYFSIPVRFDRPIELNPCGLSLSYRPGQPLWLGITKWGGRIFSKWRQTLFSVCELMKNVYLTYSRHFLTTCTTHSIHSFDTFQVSSRLRNAPKTSSHAGHQVGTAGCRKKKVLVLPFLCGSVSRCWRGLLHVCVCLFSFSRVSFFSLDGQRLC